MGGQVPSVAEREQRVAALGARQHGVVARRQLLSLGLSARMVERRLEAGRLQALYRGVYALGHRGLGTYGRWMAAVLASGEGALLSHRSAAALWGLVAPRDPIEVSSRHPGRRKSPLTHAAKLHPEDRSVVAAIPVTAVARTLLDLADTVDRSRLERAWEEADRLRLLEIQAVRRACARSRNRPGHRALKDLIADAADPVSPRSPLEGRFAVFCREQRLPEPSFNTQVLEREADACWPRERLVVELDGFSFHRHRAAFERDRARDAALQIAGYRVLRITHRRLTREPSVVADEIRGLLARGRP